MSITMAYLRGDRYIWSDGEDLHIWVRDGREPLEDMEWSESDRDGGIAIDQASIDQYVLMRVAEMAGERCLQSTLDTITKSDQGNFGGATLRRNQALLKQLFNRLAADFEPGDATA